MCGGRGPLLWSCSNWWGGLGYALWLKVHSAKVKVNYAILHYTILITLFNILNRSVIALSLDLTFSSGPGMVRVRAIARVRAGQCKVRSKVLAMAKVRAMARVRLEHWLGLRQWLGLWLGPGQWVGLGLGPE